MQTANLHPKILALQRKLGSTPIFRSTMKVTQKGELIDSKDETSRLIKAYHCVWGVPDDYGTVWHKGCFSKSITDRGPASNAKQKILTIFMHDMTDPLCVPNLIKEDDYGLYAEWEPDDVISGNRTVTQVRSGTINQFSFGANYIWDKMKYDEKDDMVHIYEAELLELSPVSFGSQSETYAIRSAKDYDKQLLLLREDTEDFIKAFPRQRQLEIRSIIDRHISLAKIQPDALRQESTENDKPDKIGSVNYDSLINNLKKSFK